MSTLAAYLKRPDAMTLTALASELGVSKGRLSQLRDSTEWPAELALAAESKTGGALSASVLSPTIARARQTGAAA
jgi:DNA-binding transcriptional regulator YdaS (Cro superfamily)